MTLPGTATVAYTYPTRGVDEDGRPIVGLTVAVMADGIVPYSTMLEEGIPLSLRDYVTTGTVLPVQVDETNQNVVRVDWAGFERSSGAQAPGTVAPGPAAAKPAAQAWPPPQPAAPPIVTPPPPVAPPAPDPTAPATLPTMPSVPPVPGASPMPTMPSVPPVPLAGAPPAAGGQTAGAGSADSLDKLAKLNELRESGALSPAEYEAAKAKILGDL